MGALLIYRNFIGKRRRRMEIQEGKGSSCKGIMLRAHVNHYHRRYPYEKGRIDKISLKVDMNVLKLKSCSGCEYCGGMWEQMGNICNEWPVRGFESVEHGKLYRLGLEVSSNDPVTGEPDDWDFYLEEVKK